MADAGASLRPWFTHPRMVPKWIGGTVAGVAAGAFWHGGSGWALLIGLLFFFPNEYLVHRWVYHKAAVAPGVRGPAKSHIEHHITPTEQDRIFNDPRFSVTMGLVYFLLAWAVTADAGWAAAFSAGSFVGLLYYEYVHFTAHRPGVRPWMPWLRRLKRMHLWHHYKSEHYWFGVTTKVFDRSLGSYRDPTAVAKSPTVRTLVPPERLRAEMEAGQGR